MSNSWGGEGWPTPTFPHEEWITDILQEACPRDCITKAGVLTPGEAILFFGRHLHKERLLYRNAKDVELGLRGPVNCAGRTVQVEVTANTVQEGCWAIADAIMEKKMKARGPGCPWWSRGATWFSAAAHDIDNWMWGLDEGVTEREIGGTDNIHTHNYKWGHTFIPCIGGGWQQRKQGMPGIPRCFPGGSPSSGGGSSDHKSNQSSLHLTMKRTFHSSHRLACAGRGLWVKVNFPTFKDGKSKDAIIYCLWWWDVTIFVNLVGMISICYHMYFVHCKDSWVI